MSNLVLTDGDETTLATAPDHDDADHAGDHDPVAETAAIDAAIDAVAESGTAADPDATDGEVAEAVVADNALAADDALAADEAVTEEAV
ncbi:MAG TPA: hypothetical protein VII33_09805, partial [Nakamurella sp.]